MREIKFRAWDKENGSMHKVEEISFHEDGTISGILQDGRGRYYLNEKVLVEGDYVDDVVSMQYTGLKDKNEKEIYEGDIIKDEFDRIFIVKWFDSEARFAIKEINKKTPYKMVINHLKIEVLGNIYENPELLEV